jgi:hypothetical protein
VGPLNLLKCCSELSALISSLFDKYVSLLASITDLESSGSLSVLKIGSMVMILLLHVSSCLDT